MTNRKEVKQQQLTWVCQKWGRIVGLSIWNSIEHYRKSEHSYFKIPSSKSAKTLALRKRRLLQTTYTKINLQIKKQLNLYYS